MTKEIVLLLDRELPDMNGAARDALAAKIAALVEKLRKRGKK